MRGQLASFELADGSRFFYEPDAAQIELFLHGSKCLEADYRSEPRPEPPEVLQAVAKARDRRSAVERLYASDPVPFAAHDLEKLVERGELVPRSFLAGHSHEESVAHFAKKNERK
jgi:hypothetical protein